MIQFLIFHHHYVLTDDERKGYGKLTNNYKEMLTQRKKLKYFYLSALYNAT